LESEALALFGRYPCISALLWIVGKVTYLAVLDVSPAILCLARVGGEEQPIQTPISLHSPNLILIRRGIFDTCYSLTPGLV
jgi:hypothetical protein